MKKKWFIIQCKHTSTALATFLRQRGFSVIQKVEHPGFILIYLSKDDFHKKLGYDISTEKNHTIMDLPTILNSKIIKNSSGEPLQIPNKEVANILQPQLPDPEEGYRVGDQVKIFVGGCFLGATIIHKNTITDSKWQLRLNDNERIIIERDEKEIL